MTGAAHRRAHVRDAGEAPAQEDRHFKLRFREYSE